MAPHAQPDRRLWEEDAQGELQRGQGSQEPL